MHGKSRHMEMSFMFFRDVLSCAFSNCGFLEFLNRDPIQIISAYFQPGIYPQFIP
jgi:hypothetical protein